VRAGTPAATLAEVLPTTSTTVRDVTGAPLEWSAGAAGLRVALPSSPHGDPVVVLLGNVDARGRA